MSWLYPDPGPSCRLIHSSFANLTILEYFFKVMSSTHFLLQFPSLHKVNISNNVVSSPSPSNNNCGKFSCKDLEIRDDYTIFTFTANITFWFKAYHTQIRLLLHYYQLPLLTGIDSPRRIVVFLFSVSSWISIPNRKNYAFFTDYPILWNFKCTYPDW